MFPFGFRNLSELLQIATGRYERHRWRIQISFNPSGFELFDLPIKKWKAAKELRTPDEINLIVAHITAVDGGFGVSKKRVAFWEKQLLNIGDEYRDLISQIPDREDATAQRLALWERFRGTLSYHQIGAQNGDSLANRELEHRTYHGNTGNRGAGWALDVGPKEKLTPWLIQTGQASLTHLVRRLSDAHPITVAPHRCFSASRREDTGGDVWRRVVLPVVQQFDHLRVDYDLAENGGRPIPRSWDPSATHDDKGRKL
jgi:hypothetical protein